METTLAAAEPPSGPVVQASLLSESTHIEAGRPFRLGVLMMPKEQWHTYWENPGDAGIPTTLTWTLPEGFAASAIDWPAPQRISEGPLVTFSYTGALLLPVTIVPPAELQAGSYPVKVKAEWLVCHEICIPETVELALTLTAGETAPSEHAVLFAEHDKRRAAPLSILRPYTLREKHITLSLPVAKEESVTSAYFFPRQQNIVMYAAPQVLGTSENGYTLTLERAGEAPSGNISGILQVETEAGSRYFDVMFSSDVPIAPVAPTASVSPAQPAALSAGIILFALLGGLILNLMPCVLPVLSLKAIALVKKAGSERRQVLVQGFAYTGGILLSFAVFAAVLLALRHAGEAVGWGYQMQSPAFVGFLIYLLFLVGLNLSGLFELPVLLGNVGGEIANESSARGSFFTGILATAVATPCTAPFMASAVGIALSLPTWQALLVFETLGLGLALPFLLVSIFPALLRFLPKPGAWMDTFKHILAFPMYASVIWLLWVLTMQTGTSGMVVALTGLLVVTAIVTLKTLLRHRFIVLLALAAVIGFSLPTLSRLEITETRMPGKLASEGVDMMEYSAKDLAALREMGRPVYLDATAAWCITCQVNARVALHTEATMKAFRDKGVVLMIADWTRRNAEITALLQGFGHEGVPLNVYYPPRGEPIVLPQILTEDIVISTISK